MFRRNKIRVEPSVGKGSLPKNENLRQGNKIKIPTLYDESDEEDAELELRLKQRKKKVLNSKKAPISKSETHSVAYTEKIEAVASAPEVVRQGFHIMNMDDLDDEAESDLEGLPSRQDIQSIKRQRALLQQHNTTSGTGFYANSENKSVEYDERNYVKLLTKDDKYDLMETIGNDAHDDDNDDVNDVAFDASLKEFDDEKLILSRSEAINNNQKRREDIENALNDRHDAEWEAHQLHKVSHAGIISSLPALGEGALSTENLIDVLKELVISSENRRKVLNVQVNTIHRDCEELESRKKVLLANLDDLIS